jgi:hypothetical protein
VRKLKVAALAGVAVLLLVVLAEVGVRLSGVTDIPLYRPDAHYGYIPRANQHGVWLHKYRWGFNSLSMGIDEEFHPGGVLLVSDSIVSGGNQTDQQDRVAQKLERLIGQDVWPISAGSWALLNELAWLRENPEVVRNVDRFVFILNDEDFIAPSVWLGKSMNNGYIHPSRLYYLFDRLVLLPRRPVPPRPPTSRDWQKEFAAFRASVGKPVLVILYSGRADRPDTIEQHEGQFGTDVLVLKRDRRWRTAVFRDRIHLEAEGNALLAQIIAERIRADSPARQARRR